MLQEQRPASSLDGVIGTHLIAQNTHHNDFILVLKMFDSISQTKLWNTD